MIAAAPRTERRAYLTSKGEEAVAMVRIRDGFDGLAELDRARLAAELRTLADRYAPRRPNPAA
jgi:hypothetical protein